MLDGSGETEGTLQTETASEIPTKIIKQVLLTPGKVLSMSILLNHKSLFRKTNGLSGKRLVEKVVAEIPKLLLADVETYNVTKNKTKVR